MPAARRRSSALASNLRRVLRRPQFWVGLAVLAPTLVYYFIFHYFPIARGLWLAVVDYDFVTRTSRGFIGLDNFRQLLINPLLVTSIENTLLLAVMQYSVTMPLALFLATCLTNVRRGVAFYQGAIFLPVVVSLVGVSLLFRFLMDPEVGAFNEALRALGLPTSKWLTSPDSVLPTLAGIDVWKGMGFTVVLLAAGMMNIPSELNDAARVDGVNEWQRFWYVTLPLLGHTLALVMVLGAIGSLQVYTSVVVLTGSASGAVSTYVYNVLIVQEAFTTMRFGTAAAAASLQFLLIFLITIVQLKLITPKWSY